MFIGVGSIACLALNIGFVIYNVRCSLRWYRIDRIMKHLCVDAWEARGWPMWRVWLPVMQEAARRAAEHRAKGSP